MKLTLLPKCRYGVGVDQERRESRVFLSESESRDEVWAGFR